jgi:hypothetical protein
MGFLCLLSADAPNTQMSLLFWFFHMYIPCIDRILHLELVLADLLQLEFFLLCLAHDVDGPGSEQSKTKCEYSWSLSYTSFSEIVLKYIYIYIYFSV